MKCEACQARGDPNHVLLGEAPSPDAEAPNLVAVYSRTGDVIGLVCPVCKTPHGRRECERCGTIFNTSTRRKLCRAGCKGESETARFDQAP